MITETKTTPDKFNGLLFEIEHKCVVYKADNLTYFVSEKTIKNLDNLIADNLAAVDEAALLLQ